MSSQTGCPKILSEEQNPFATRPQGGNGGVFMICFVSDQRCWKVMECTDQGQTSLKDETLVLNGKHEECSIQGLRQMMVGIWQEG